MIEANVMSRGKSGCLILKISARLFTAGLILAVICAHPAADAQPVSPAQPLKNAQSGALEPNARKIALRNYGGHALDQDDAAPKSSNNDIYETGIKSESGAPGPVHAQSENYLQGKDPGDEEPVNTGGPNELRLRGDYLNPPPDAPPVSVHALPLIYCYPTEDGAKRTKLTSAGQREKAAAPRCRSGSCGGKKPPPRSPSNLPSPLDPAFLEYLDQIADDKSDVTCVTSEEADEGQQNGSCQGGNCPGSSAGQGGCSGGSCGNGTAGAGGNGGGLGQIMQALGGLGNLAGDGGSSSHPSPIPSPTPAPSPTLTPTPTPRLNTSRLLSGMALVGNSSPPSASERNVRAMLGNLADAPLSSARKCPFCKPGKLGRKKR